MKKALFFLVVTGILGSLQAQNNAPVNSKANRITVTPMQAAQMRVKARQDAQKANASANSTSPSRKNHRVGGAEPHLPFLGSSANVNGILDATTTAVTANQACNLIVMTHRDNNSNVASCGTGAYVAAYSTNGGSVWDSTVTLFCNPASGPGVRYPNGVIFNPLNGTVGQNTNPSNAFDVMSGPYTNGSEWVETVYGSTTFGGTTHNQGYWINGNPGVQIQNNGDLSFMSSSDDSTVHVMGEGFITNSAQTVFYSWLGGVLTTGKYVGAPADSFQWTQHVFLPHLVPSYAGFTTHSTFDSASAPLEVPGTAWSQDGKTGYVVFFANLDSVGYNYYTDQPIVYKTTNSGQTWNMMPPYNFRNLSSLTAHLETTLDSPSVKIPLWYGFNTTNDPNQGALNNYDLTVDYQGNLHIFGVIVSSIICSPDSSFTVSFHANQDGYIYDVYTTSPTGGWQSRFIDSMMTLPINNAGRSSINSDWDSSSTAAYIGFGNRLQASRTTDGKHVFCTWVDDVTNNFPGELDFPDVFGQGYDVATHKAGEVYQFTTSAQNYFLCVSDIVLTSTVGSDTTYTVPCTIAYPQQTPDDGTEPINYYYLGSVQYSDTLGKTSGSPFSSIPTVASQGFTISPNYPNPFSNTTQFNIGLTNEDVVSVDVFNLFGQKVYSMPSQQMSSGNHLMTINGSGWSAGVYFYRVTVGDQSKTQKMVVQ
jgi:hypothetical protein